ncbi:MAG: hypothetical protein Q7U69_07095 [Sulfuricurvum sp.]|uniref:hypothetical protein n=1 Tax=Sulfuricurvum sp. TaxID=2025608 RepID=UPI00271A8A8E|nr:hypothetical protein [Sulfuricurvum sp.]MDO9056302.1 hypothetical protein [Sulfuricurvum sp.]
MTKYLLIGFMSMMMLHAAVPAVSSPSITVMTQPNTDKELVWVDEQILAILPARVGIPDGYINSLRDPMKMKKALPTLKSGSNLLAPPKLGSMGILAQPKVIEEPLRLLAIMNKSVLISGKWYKVGQSIRNFTLAEIKSNSVLLTGKKDQKLILFLHKQNNNIKIITK